MNILFNSPSPSPEGNSLQDLSTLFGWIWSTMQSIQVSIGNFTFSMIDVSITVIILSLLGYVLGKLLNPWGGDEE